MSRSNPNENGAPNPATRWFEWNGEQGGLRYYDKVKKEQVQVGSDNFTFLLLDQLGTVGGWHEASQSGIYSNEVRDTRQDVLVVKAFKGGTLAEGLYKDIKDRVTSKSVGGQFISNCYIAYKNDAGQLAIGSIKFKGAALNAWVEFSKAHRAELYKKAIKIHGFTEGKKGRITYRVPEMRLVDTTPETDAYAVKLDQQLQEFLKAYFKRTKRDQVEETPTHVRDEDMAPDYSDAHEPPLTDDDIPF